MPARSESTRHPRQPSNGCIRGAGQRWQSRHISWGFSYRPILWMAAQQPSPSVLRAARHSGLQTEPFRSSISSLLGGSWVSLSGLAKLVVQALDVFSAGSSTRYSASCHRPISHPISGYMAG